MKNIIIAIREQQLIVEKLIANYRQEGGDDLFFVMSELDVKNAKLSAAVAKHIADSASRPEPVAPPFDPTLAPPGYEARPFDWGAGGCGRFCCFRWGPECTDRNCIPSRRPDKTSVYFVKKETP